jgi:hypothetical protein
MESEVFKICEGWAAREGDAALPTNARVLTNSLLFR